MAKIQKTDTKYFQDSTIKNSPPMLVKMQNAAATLEDT
jgi:hypothetical protein